MQSPAPLTIADIDPVIEALLAFYSSPMACWRLSGERFYAHKEQTLGGLSTLQDEAGQLNPAYQAADQPAVRHVELALTEALTCPSDLRAFLIRFAPQARWQVTEAYRGHFDNSFFDNEAWCELIGPTGLIASNDVRIGLLIMGPGLVYPAHRHPATEWYHVLSGTGQWAQGSQPAMPRTPPAALFHRSDEPHAMTTHQEPVLALWSWVGALNTSSYPVPSYPHSPDPGPSAPAPPQSG